MFENITSSQVKARRGGSAFVSVILHGLAIAAFFGAAYVKAHAPPKKEEVAVVFRAPPPPPPPPPPASHHKTTPRTTPKTPQTPRRIERIIQPKEVPKVEEPPKDDSNDDDDDNGGVEGGVEGGVRGGVVGGVVGGVLGGQLGGTGEGPAQLLGAGMTRPQPTSDCRPAKPQVPEQARAMGITGVVLVEYTVHTDGHAGDVKLKNATASPILFAAVRDWLAKCPFQPSISAGRPVAVKIIQPFNFRDAK